MLRDVFTHALAVFAGLLLAEFLFTDGVPAVTRPTAPPCPVDPANANAVYLAAARVWQSATGRAVDYPTPADLWGLLIQWAAFRAVLSTCRVHHHATCRYDVAPCDCGADALADALARFAPPQPTP